MDPVLANAQPAVSRSGRDGWSSREQTARTVLENHRGRTLSETEWETTKRDLLAFVRLLMDWERGVANRVSGSRDGVSAKS